MKKKSIILRNAVRHGFLLALLCLKSFTIRSEGSGTWNVTANRQANLMVASAGGNPAGSANEGYLNRGYMMLPSNTPGYKTEHRLYVWVKPGETVFWGFHQDGNTGGDNINFVWYYDNAAGANNYFPTATSAPARVQAQSVTFNPRNSSSSTQGIPQTELTAKNGPRQIVGAENGYFAYQFTNSTGTARAYWLEMTNSNNSSANREFNFWDITVASGDSQANYQVQTGRVYCKYWHIVNGLPNTMGVANAQSFPQEFGFYIPIDNTNTAANDFFVKYANFGRSNAGYVVFFANAEGPGTTGSYADRRKSIQGTSNNSQYPLFLNNPDPTVWPSSLLPVWDYTATFSKRADSPTGGEGRFAIVVNTACVIDILIDLNNDQIKNGNDVLLTHEFTSEGTHTIYWDGKDANGQDVAPGTTIHFISSLAFFPVHFPIYDMEQSLGITIQHIRPLRGTTVPINDVLYWDNSNITSSSPANSPQSVQINTTGLPGPNHIWHANGDNGFSQNRTINTWTGAYNDRLTRSTEFLYNIDIDLSVIKNVSPEIAAAGANVTFTIDAENLPIEGQSDAIATGVEVLDILPDGYTLVNVVVPDGTTWDQANNKWVIGTLPVGQKLTMTIEATVKPNGPYLNVAQIYGSENDINEKNNRDDATIRTFTISGNVFHDPDAGTVNNSSGGPNTVPSNLWISLVDSDQNIVTNSVALPASGVFSFSSVPGNYRIVLENVRGVEGQAPVPFTVPAGWVITGTFIGAPATGNAGILDGTSQLFTLVDTDLNNINFGMQRPPETDGSQYSLVEDPVSGSDLPLDGSIQAKNGLWVDEIIRSDSDGELTTLVITRLVEPLGVTGGDGPLSEGPVLYYDGNPVVLNEPIVGFDASKLVVKLLGKDYAGISFDFKVIDNGVATSNVSTYTVDWINFLPVTWVSVDVREEQGNSVLSWSTVEEKNVASFEIQHSTSARTWRVVGTQVPTNEPVARYQFIHKPERSAVHYYRIKNIDLDGSSSFSPIVSLRGQEASQLMLYPNPVESGILKLETDLSAASQIRVFSLAGVEVIRTPARSNVLNVANLVSGTYILQISNTDGSTQTKTFVVK